MTAPPTLAPINRLLDIMARLRDPETGCPWDVEQNFSTIAPYTIEEAYEVADAIDRGDTDDLRDELGDLLLQVVFHARMAEEARLFDFDDVANAIADKMIRRHPHVFGDSGERTASAQRTAWEDHKAAERSDRNAQAGLLDGIPRSLPALLRAYKLQRRAARVGFDWPDATPLFDKIDEEVAEIKAELTGRDRDRLEDEVGDLLFACANLARHLGVDPEAALRRANAKFERRFGKIEATLGERGRTLSEADLDEMEEIWTETKDAEKQSRDRWKDANG
jgi:ATP diphosphatase